MALPPPKRTGGKKPTTTAPKPPTGGLGPPKRTGGAPRTAGGAATRVNLSGGGGDGGGDGGLLGNLAGAYRLFAAAPQAGAGMLKEGAITAWNLSKLAAPPGLVNDIPESEASTGEQITEKIPFLAHTAQSIGNTAYRVTHPVEAASQYGEAWNRGEASWLGVEDAGNLAILATAGARLAGARAPTVNASISEAAAMTGERAAPALSLSAETVPEITSATPRGRIGSTVVGAKEYLDRLPGYLREEARAPVKLQGKGIAGALERADVLPRVAAGAEAVGDVFRGVRYAGERVGNAPFAPFGAALRGASKIADVINPSYGGGFGRLPEVALAAGERAPGIRGLVTGGVLKALNRSDEPTALNERLRASMWNLSPEGGAVRADIADITKRNVESERVSMSPGTLVDQEVRAGRISAEDGALAGRVGLLNVSQHLEPLVRIVEDFEGRITHEQFDQAVTEMYARGGFPVEPGLRPTMMDVAHLIAYRKGLLPEGVQRLAADVEATQRHLTGVREDIELSQNDWQKVKADPNVPGDVDHYVPVQEDIDTGARVRTDQPLNPEQLQPDLMPSVIRGEQVPVEKVRDRQQREWERRANQNARDERLLAAQTAVNAALPDPPTPRQVRNATLFERRQAAERTHYRSLQASLDDAIGAYVRASEIDAPAAHVEALNNLDRAEAALKSQREQIARLEKWSDEQQVFGRVEDIEEGPPRIEGETANEYGMRVAEWQMEQSVGQLEDLNEQYGLNQARRPDVDVGGARSQITDITETAKQVVAEQSQAARARIDQMAGTDRPAISPREGVDPGGEYDWWNEPAILGLDEQTKRRLLTEGWVRPDTVLDEAKGKGKRVPNPMPRIAPDDFAQIINQALDSDMHFEAAIGTYIDAIRELWDISKKSDHVVDLVAQEMGLPPTQVAAALRGKISDYGGLLAEEANTAIDDLAAAAAALSDEERATFSAVFDDLVEEGDGNITLDSMEELLGFYFPGLDVGSQEGLLAALDGATDLTALGDWLRGGTRTPFPEQLRAKLGELGPSQYRQQGAIGQQIGAAKREGRSLEARFRAAQAAVDKALEQGEKAQEKASGRIDKAQEQLVEGEPTQGPTMKTGNAMPGAKAHLRRQWYDSDGVLHTAEMSPAERARLREGQLQARAARSRVQMNRARLAVERSNAKIADMPAELARSLQDRVVEVNQRGVRSMTSGVNSMSAKFGGLVGKGDGTTVTGLMGRLAAKYKFIAELHQFLDEAKANAEAAGETLTAADQAEVFDMLYEQYAPEHMSVQDATAWEDSKGAAILTDEINQVLAENGGALRLNAPHRIKEIIDQSDWNMPQEVRNRVAGSYSRWNAARVKVLDSMTDAYARAMPTTYRQLHLTAKRGVSEFLDLAERMNQAHPGSGDVFLDAAETIITTMRAMVDDAKINPAHLIGGEAPKVGRGRGGPAGAARRGAKITQRNIGTQTLRRTDLRELDVDAYARVERERARKIALNQRDQWVIDKYGTPARDIPFVRDEMERNLAETGEHLTSGQIDQLAETAGYVKADSATKAGPSTVYLRRQIKAALEEHTYSPHLPMRVLRATNKVFKTAVLALSTRWLTGNVFGNIFQAWVNGGVGPVTLLSQWLKVQNAMGGLRESYRKEGVYEGAPAALTQHGLTASEYRMAYGGTDKIPRRFSPNRLAAKSYRLNQWVDNMVRNSVYYTKLAEGVPSEAAIMTVQRALGDYTRLNAFERTYAREIMPFYTWLRHSTLAAMRLPITSPARTAMFLHLSTLFADPDETNAALNFMGGKFPLGGDKFLDIAGNWSAFPDVEASEFGPFDPRGIGGQIAPAGKLLAGLAFGLNTATWKPLSRPADTRNRDEFGAEAATPTFSRLFADPLGAVRETGWQISQQMPTQIRSIRDIVLGSDKRYSGSGALLTGDQAGTDPNKELLPLLLKVGGLPYPWTLPEGLRKED